jgi:CDP-glucose 4,6-dehydratase
MWGKDASWKLDGKKHPHEAHYLKLDCSKAKSQIGWSPTWNLETTLHAIVSWHKEYLAQKDMRVVVSDQINAFLKEKI